MKKLGIAIVALSLVVGCIPSLHEIYTKDTLIYDANLVGTWKEDPNSKNVWIFEKADPNFYKFTYIENGKSGKFDAHLCKIGNMRYLDLYPQDPNLPYNDFYKMHLIAVHTFLKVESVSPILLLRAMKLDELAEKLKADPNFVKHEEGGESILLTASPKDLQKFLIAVVNEPNLYGDLTELERFTDPNTTLKTKN